MTIALVIRTICYLKIAVLISLPSVVLAEEREDKKARILRATEDFSKSEQFERYQGGSGTNLKQLNRDAFSLPSAALSFEQQSDFAIGNGIFDRTWVKAPSSTTASDGLGPLFNARSCQGCHIKDGRGHPPEPGDVNMVSMLFSLSDSDGNPDEKLGAQFQDQAITGMDSEGQVSFTYEESTFNYPDGHTISLRKPIYNVDATLGKNVSLNPRIAPPMIGLGLVEAIAAEDIAAIADPDDTNNDQISGRVNVLSDGNMGRFGWKATAPSILEQVANAFNNDMGLSTRLRPTPSGDCTESQPACLSALHGTQNGLLEVEDSLLDLVVFYSANLAVPVRRDIDNPDVLEGKSLFYKANCVGCHTPKMATQANAEEPQRNQLIWPYSDFLLHDLGPGLADANPTHDIDGAEWRTQPLWGIGLTEIVNGHTFFLHDGRARSIEEAILWHAGEAQNAVDTYVNYSKDERNLMLRFLDSL